MNKYLPFICAHRTQKKQLAGVHAYKRGKQRHNGNDNADKKGHYDNRTHICAGPDDYNGTERNFWQGVQNDEIRLAYLTRGFTPPKCGCNYKSDCRRNGKAYNTFQQSNADMTHKTVS